jgi:dephospho-CoA kinase
VAAAGQVSGRRLLGLTGPIACGKTTVGDTLLTLGALERIDADRVVHALMARGTPTTQAIADAFGAQLLLPDGGVDRKRLGEIVFADAAALRRLEAITHPAVREEIRRRVHDLGDRDGVVVVDAVKLLQSDLLPMMDAVWVVQCPPEEEMRRLTTLRGMTSEEAGNRLAAQPPFDHPAVTAVIQNAASLEQLRDAVGEAWRTQISRWTSTSA